MVSAELAISIGPSIGATLRAQPAERVRGGSIELCRANAVRVPRVLLAAR